MKFRPLLCLALIHLLVDAYAQVVTPLWPRLKKEFGLDPWALTALLAAWQMATSVSQPFFGYWGDRFGSRWLIGLGPALAIVCLCLIGYAPGAFGLVLLLMAGGLGIGAFHPEAAVGVVEAAGSRTTNGLALFTFGGMVGLGIGPVISGTLVGKHGLPGLTWALLPGLVLLGVLVLLGRPGGQHASVRREHVGLAAILEGRWLSVGLLLGVATLRVVPVLGVPLGLAFLLDRQGKSEADIGWPQGLFLLSGGVGTLVCPLFARPGREVPALVGTILPAAGCLVLLTSANPWVYYAGLVGSGLLLQGAIPVLIAYSQRLLPRGRRLAASLTLGASWGMGGMIVAGLQAYFTAVGRLEGMLWAMVAFAVAAALGSTLLPRLPAAAGDVPVAGGTGPALENVPV